MIFSSLEEPHVVVTNSLLKHKEETHEQIRFMIKHCEEKAKKKRKQKRRRSSEESIRRQREMKKAYGSDKTKIVKKKVKMKTRQRQANTNI